MYPHCHGRVSVEGVQRWRGHRYLNSLISNFWCADKARHTRLPLGLHGLTQTEEADCFSSEGEWS
jgi:hypothetical protein